VHTTVTTNQTNVQSVFGRTGIVVATSGDYTVSQITGAAPTASPTFTGSATAGLASYTAAIANSASVVLAGSYESSATGPTYAEDSWTIQNVIGAGLNGTSTLTFTHSGTSGVASISFPAGSIGITALSADTIGLTDSTGLFSVTGSPATLGGGLTLNAFANQSANKFLGGPTSGAAAPSSFRTLVAADIPPLQSSFVGLQLATPGAPTITKGGTGSGTNYSYVVVAKDKNGTTFAGILSTCGSIASAAGSISGNSTLSGTNYNIITWTAVANAVSYDVYRTVGGTTQGYIGNTTALTLNDTGLTANGWTAPIYNTSGSVLMAFDSTGGNGAFDTSIGEIWKTTTPISNLSASANQNNVELSLRYFPAPFVVNKITVTNVTSAASGEVCGFGLYDQNLNLIAHTTFVASVLNGGGTPKGVSAAVLENTSPTLVPGWYWIAMTSSASTPTATFPYFGQAATGSQYLCIRFNVNRICRGGNASSSGVLPATQTLTSTNDGRSGLLVVYEQ